MLSFFKNRFNRFVMFGKPGKGSSRLLDPNGPAPEMSYTDKAVIEAFAKGDESQREAALNVYYGNRLILGTRGNAHQNFMAEVDHVSYDAVSYQAAKARLLREIN